MNGDGSAKQTLLPASETSLADPPKNDHIQGETYSVDLQWHKQGYPVIYVVGHGAVTSPRDALLTIQRAVKLIDASPFTHVCAVYQMLDITHMPMLARFIRSGSFPSSRKTAHIIIGTHNQAIQLAASLSAVLGSKGMRTMVACRTDEEIDRAVKRWLALNTELRGYTLRDV